MNWIYGAYAVCTFSNCVSKFKKKQKFKMEFSVRFH